VQGLVGREQVALDRVQLVPERLGVDREPGARHLPHLARERQVIDVLRDGDRHGKVDRVAAPRHELRRPERGVHAPAARAAVLLAAVAHEAVGALDDVDLVGVLGLARPLGELSAAGGAGPVGLVEGVDDLELRELGLRAGTVAAPGRRRSGRLVRGRSVRCGSPPLLRGAAEELLLAGRELFAQPQELELERLGCVLALGLREQRRELAEPAVELLDLLLLQPRDLAEHLGSRLAGEIDHDA